MAAINRPPRAILLRSYTAGGEAIAAVAAGALDAAGVERLDHEQASAVRSSGAAATDAIDQADFVLADVTGSDPNVLFELGYAYGRGKPILLLLDRSRSPDLPFDIRDFRFLLYRPQEMQSLHAQLLHEVTQLARRSMIAA
jgi:nucleoside 2-deoxyribosyltransferase